MIFALSSLQQRVPALSLCGVGQKDNSALVGLTTLRPLTIREPTPSRTQGLPTKKQRKLSDPWLMETLWKSALGRQLRQAERRLRASIRAPARLSFTFFLRPLFLRR